MAGFGEEEEDGDEYEERKFRPVEFCVSLDEDVVSLRSSSSSLVQVSEFLKVLDNIFGRYVYNWVRGLCGARGVRKKDDLVYEIVCFLTRSFFPFLTTTGRKRKLKRRKLGKYRELC